MELQGARRTPSTAPQTFPVWTRSLSRTPMLSEIGRGCEPLAGRTGLLAGAAPSMPGERRLRATPCMHRKPCFARCFTWNISARCAIALLAATGRCALARGLLPSPPTMFHVKQSRGPGPAPPPWRPTPAHFCSLTRSRTPQSCRPASAQRRVRPLPGRPRPGKPSGPATRYQTD